MFRHCTMPTEIDYDAEHNTIVLRFRGVVTAADTHAIEAAASALIARARPGFHLFTDLTGLEQMDLDCVRDLTGFMDRCLQAGVAGIVRVIPDPDKDIGFGLLSLTHYRGRVPITTVPTVEEARGQVSKFTRG